MDELMQDLRDDQAARVPEPLPLPVTGFESHRERESGNRRASAWILVAGVALALAIISSAGGYFVYTAWVVPQRRIASVVSTLKARAQAEYPGFEILSVYAVKASSSAGGPINQENVYFDMRFRSNEDFRYSAVYTARLSQWDQSDAYGNDDSFFVAGAYPSQLATSFIERWTRGHAGARCAYVIESAGSLDATRAYEVGFITPSTGSDPGVLHTTYLAYAPESGTWIEKPSQDRLYESAGVRDPFDDMVSDFETETIVATALPSFEVVRAVPTLFSGEGIVLVRSTKHRGLMYLACLPIVEGYPEDPLFDLLEERDARGRAFVRQWLERHPRSAISEVEFDPDSTGDANLMTVCFATTIPKSGEIDDWEYMDTVKYSPKSGTWRWLKSE